MLELTDIIKGFSMCSLSPESSSKSFFKEPSRAECVFWGFWQGRAAGVMRVARNLGRFMWLAGPTVAHTFSRWLINRDDLNIVTNSVN